MKEIQPELMFFYLWSW